MTPKLYPTNLRKQAIDILGAWKEIDPALSFGSVSVPALEEDLAQAAPLLAQIASLEAQLTDLRNQRDSLFISIWDKLKRVRVGMKAIYGDDSSEYQMAGGTRRSDHKRYVRNNKANPGQNQQQTLQD
jgi:hypothetical protein